MLFNSYLFWTFFLGIFLLYRRLPHRGQNTLLLLASYVFYGAWDWRFLSLIWVSTIVDYVVAMRLEKTTGDTQRRGLLTASIVVNLGLLGVFKYMGFFAAELSGLLTYLGLSVDLPVLQVVLPVGISFYTFQTMSYTIDVYRGVIPPTRRLSDFALYVAFFPQLVAGPIERSKDLMPQISQPRAGSGEDFRVGLYHVLIGLFKKVVVADNLAVFVDAIFSADAATLTGGECLVGVYAFAFQIYADFSGYSSMAQGIARWMGFDLMFNFRMPYFAVNPSDFWRRWHISLSSWLRDYLYIPLGGNRGRPFRVVRNLMLTMLLGGLWHGAGWTFLAWGAFHGALLCAYRGRSAEPPPSVARRVFHAIVFFHLVCVGWLLFRADSIGQAGTMLARIATNLRMGGLAWTGIGMIVFFAGPLVLYELWVERQQDMLALLRRSWVARGAVCAYSILMLAVFSAPQHHAFIYFQF